MQRVLPVNRHDCICLCILLATMGFSHVLLTVHVLLLAVQTHEGNSNEFIYINYKIGVGDGETTFAIHHLISEIILTKKFKHLKHGEHSVLQLLVRHCLGSDFPSHISSIPNLYFSTYLYLLIILYIILLYYYKHFLIQMIPSIQHT
jgi:hypothetical protein